MSAHNWLYLYAVALVAASFVHEPAVLAGGLVSALIFSGKTRWRLLKRSVLAILAFNLTVSLGYILVARWQGNFHADYLLLVNLRVLLMVFLGFWFTCQINLLATLRGWTTLELLATLALSQIRLYTRIISDFRLAFMSRNAAQPRLLDQARNAAATGQTLLNKSLANSTEVALAMRSRGTFDD